MQQFGLIRDKATGLPKFDDPSTCHPIQAGMMTRAEREALGIHPGPWAMTADGPVPVEGDADTGFRALQDMRALGQLVVPGDEAGQTQVFRVTPRTDHKAGAQISGSVALIAQETGA